MTTPTEVLMVEDNPGDAWLVQEAVRESQLPYRVTVMADGECALEFLQRRGAHAQAPRPELILLDLNLPRMNGRQLLSLIRPDPELGRIPVAILTSSLTDQDVLATYGLRPDAYFVKPMDYTSYLDLLQRIDAFRRRAGQA